MTQCNPEPPQIHRSPQSEPGDSLGTFWGDRHVVDLNLYPVLRRPSCFSNPDGGDHTGRIFVLIAPLVRIGQC
ncbi:hypothetical protein NG791_20930 [Laspinema sp. D1]|uniref:hypothetical protein n=1 Tax=Laspinema palackyanum TaxID=3231601 RepID=UPI00348FCB30|nr:hypothetical protein [Laspinema sp. D2b]